jgi:hypothetical protein
VKLTDAPGKGPEEAWNRPVGTAHQQSAAEKPPQALEELLDSVRQGAESYRVKHPEDRVVCSVTNRSALWLSGVRSLQLDGYVLPIDDEGTGVTFMSTDGSKPDQPLTDELLWFHPQQNEDEDDDDFFD